MGEPLGDDFQRAADEHGGSESDSPSSGWSELSGSDAHFNDEEFYAYQLELEEAARLGEPPMDGESTDDSESTEDEPETFRPSGFKKCLCATLASTSSAASKCRFCLAPKDQKRPNVPDRVGKQSPFIRILQKKREVQPV